MRLLMASQEMIDRFLADPEAKLPPKKKGARKQPTRSRRPRAISPARREELEAWAYIKRTMLIAQVRTDGFNSCMECGAKNPHRLELDHIVPTGRGGAWEPENAQLLCAGAGSCHECKTGAPQWSEVAS